MVNLILFIIIISVSMIVVKIGAVAFELTGLEDDVSAFQSLSCFTNTGFTTKEAELITGNPTRRKIARVLIILGHVGFVTLIATFANSLNVDRFRYKQWVIPFTHININSKFLPLINIIIIIAVVYCIYKISTHSKTMNKFGNFLRQRIFMYNIVKVEPYKEIAVEPNGYGVVRIVISEKSPLLNKLLSEINLTSQDILLLAIQRNHLALSEIEENTKILFDDQLLCYGKLDLIKSVFGVGM